VEQSRSDADGAKPVDEAEQALLERCLDALEDDPYADLTALLAGEPTPSPAVRRQLALLGRAGLLPQPEDETKQPERLGEFRIVRQLGRGGMGVVYLAVQDSLGREVALKLVHPEHLYFPLARDRFRREVRAAARLQHPGIVPVHTFGEADGIPYYAMERVRGASLAELLEQLRGTPVRDLDARHLREALERALEVKGETFRSAELPPLRGSWVLACARLIRDVALALQHAHEQDVLHRDLKPSNLLLAVDGRILLIDFGLARTDGDARLTRTGATLGSLPYQAPEQLRDPALADRRTDIHALGATLYELLTLVPPFGDGSSGTRERILGGGVDAPSRLNPQVPADLDAICLCALASQPQHRYPNAAALAEDLERFLDRRPVLARRPSAVQRLCRQVRRHPAAAVAIVSLSLLLFGAPVAFALQQKSAAAELRAALDLANQERERAAAHLGQALEAFDTMLSRTAASRLAKIPRTARLRRQLLEDALAFHLRLVEREPGDDRVRLATAGAYRRVGAIRAELGELTTALDEFGRAGELLDSLDGAATGPRALRVERVELLAALAKTHGRLGRYETQLEFQRQQVGALAALLAEAPDDATLRGDHARARIDLAVFVGRRGEHAAARHLIGEVLADLERWIAEPATPQVLRRLLTLEATAFDGRAMVAVTAGDPAAADRDLREAAARAERVLALDAEDPEALQRLAGTRLRRAMLLHELHDFGPAAAAHDEAVALYEQLVRAEPEDPDWTSQLALLLSTRADLHARTQDFAAAREDHERALEILDELVARQPEEMAGRARRAIARGQFATFLGATGDRSGQRAQLDLAIADQRALFAESGEDPRLARNLAVSLAISAQLRGEEAEPGAARRDVGDALALLRAHSEASGIPLWISVLRIQFDLAFGQGDEAAAVGSLDEADQVCARWLAELPDDAQRLTAATALGNERVRLLLGQDRLDEAQALLERALPSARRAVEQGFAPARVELATLLLRLSDVGLRRGDEPAAKAWFVAAVREAGAERAAFAEVASLAALFDRPDFAAAAGDQRVQGR
jgi:serine/threonine protein kinase